MLGANIGFTVTVQLLAFKFYVLSKNLARRGAGQAVLGGGFLLLAITLIAEAVVPLKSNPDVARIVEILERQPVWRMWFAVALKVVLQSATATIGIAIALCAQGVFPVNASADGRILAKTALHWLEIADEKSTDLDTLRLELIQYALKLYELGEAK